MILPRVAPPGRDGFDALGFDPAPGQLVNLEALSIQYQEVALSLAAAYEALTQIGTSSSSWQGEAAQAFQNAAPAARARDRRSAQAGPGDRAGGARLLREPR
ncbi:MAG: hypothetical protein ACRDTC_23945 [Pseudonocardiaceae bacterium]